MSAAQDEFTNKDFQAIIKYFRKMLELVKNLLNNFCKYEKAIQDRNFSQIMPVIKSEVLDQTTAINALFKINLMGNELNIFASMISSISSFELVNEYYQELLDDLVEICASDYLLESDYSALGLKDIINVFNNTLDLLKADDNNSKDFVDSIATILHLFTSYIQLLNYLNEVSHQINIEAQEELLNKILIKIEELKTILSSAFNITNDLDKAIIDEEAGSAAGIIPEVLDNDGALEENHDKGIMSAANDTNAENEGQTAPASAPTQLSSEPDLEILSNNSDLYTHYLSSLSTQALAELIVMAGGVSGETPIDHYMMAGG